MALLEPLIRHASILYYTTCIYHLRENGVNDEKSIYLLWFLSLRVVGKGDIISSHFCFFHGHTAKQSSKRKNQNNLVNFLS